jgi:hypothetical protein
VIFAGYPLFQLVFITRNREVLTQRDFREKYGMLYENCKFKRSHTRLFIGFNLIKRSLHCILLVFFYQRPVIQSFLVFTLFLLVRVSN